MKMKGKYLYIGCAVSTFVLFPATGLQAQEEAADSLVNVAFGSVAKEDLTHAVATVSTSELLEKLNSSNSLVGLESLIGGYTGNIWGQAPLVLVDGVPRDASSVRASEVESVSVMKDAAAVVLYGSRASKGVVLITTKRGKEGPMRIDVRANTGFNVPKAYPKYLDAAGYMTLYNEACRNDGLAEHYDAATIYHTAAGTNPYRYPDIDFYSSDYVKKMYSNTDVTGEISGGSDRTQYYLNFGLNYNNDLLKYGEGKNNKDLTFNVRGNVDMQLASWLKATTNAAVVFTNQYDGRGDFWNAASTMRPNWFSPLLPTDMMDLNSSSIQSYIANSDHLIDGKYLLGGTAADQTNAFADLLAAGYIKEKARLFMFDVTLAADLSSLLEGLSFKTAYSVDYTSYYSEAFRSYYAVYEPSWTNVNGKDMIWSLQQHNTDRKDANEFIGKSTYEQTMMFSAQFDYNKTFAKRHNVSATLLGWGYQEQNSSDESHEGSDYHRTSNVNLGLRAAYNYDHKYYVGFSGAVVHSAKLPKKNRNAFSPSVTLGWRLSREDFMKNVSWIDDLMVTASYANLHQDLDIEDYYMYEGAFAKDGWMEWHDGTAAHSIPLAAGGDNPELDFITRQEFRVGLDATLFDRLLRINVNYFRNDMKGLLTQGASTIYPSYFKLSDNNSFLSWTNYNEDRRSGFDFSVAANRKFGEFDVTLGFSGMVYASTALKRDETYEFDYQYREGRPIDASYGYVCEGFFESQEEIDNSGIRQTFGTVRPGDLKYKDINGDGVIDSDDQIDLGKSGSGASPFSFGLNLNVKYRNWSLFAMGTGRTGAIGYKNSSYYWNKGTSKFSEVVWGRWTEETKEFANYPRLTTGDGSNNYRNSTFWMYKNNYFNLDQVQLTYDFPAKPFRKIPFVSGLSVYCGGTSLLTISKEREHKEMNVGGAPYCRNYYIGLKASF